MSNEETTVAKHAHQDSWVITYQDIGEQGVYLEVHTCTKCGTVFFNKRYGEIPKK